jgi:pilus assembly protein Flp/PilA
MGERRMRKILDFFAQVHDFLDNESGATTIEYAVIAGLISAGMIASFSAIGVKVGNKFLPVSGALN